jgi:hypothetical protein
VRHDAREDAAATRVRLRIALSIALSIAAQSRIVGPSWRGVQRASKRVVRPPFAARARSGTVQSAEVQPESAAQSALGACVASVANRARFATMESEVKFRLPVALRVR